MIQTHFLPFAPTTTELGSLGLKKKDLPISYLLHCLQVHARVFEHQSLHQWIE